MARDVLAYLTACHSEMNEVADGILHEYEADPALMTAFVVLLGIEASNALTLLAEAGDTTVEDLLRERGAFISQL